MFSCQWNFEAAERRLSQRIYTRSDIWSPSPFRIWGIVFEQLALSAGWYWGGGGRIITTQFGSGGQTYMTSNQKDEREDQKYL